MGDNQYAVATQAYVKLMLHAAAYPAAACCGLLLGEQHGQGFSVTDAAPLFHHEAPLAPLLEVGCALADAWCQKRGGKQQIVGFYYAGSSAATLSHFAEKVADKVEANCSRACVLLLDNAQLDNAAKPGLQLLLKDVKRGWTRVENRLRVDDAAAATLAQGLQQGVQRDLVDVEQHLEDGAKDWRNPHLVQLLKLNV